MLRNFESIALVLVLASLFPVNLGDEKVPNPFEEPDANYYSIKSTQETISASGEKALVDVLEFFSLSKGISYSIHRDHDHTKQVFALIGDATQAKFYLVRDPDSKDAFDCELDHLHNHKRVFPWQYSYKLAPTKGKEAGDSFIYGVGAIWLNAIQRPALLIQSDDDSSIQNVWQLEEAGLLVKLFFNKIQNTIPSNIEVRRKAVSNDGSGSSSYLVEYSKINVLEFETNVKSHPLLNILARHLRRCRRETATHHVFPSLMKAINLSPKRLYAIEYLNTKFGKSRVDERYSGRYDEVKGRHVWTTEFIREWLSFKLEAQVISYEGLPPPDESNQSQLEQVADIYLKRFTEKETLRSSRHSSVTYHMVEQEGQTETCKRGDNEPPPREHLMIRPIQFHRADEVQLSVKLTGIGALLMNAADIPYKEFNLFQKLISVVYDASNLHNRRLIEVDEWQFGDRKTSRRFRFYFRELRNTGKQQHEMTDLVRIDVVDAKAQVNNQQVDTDEPSNLIERFDIISVVFDADDGEIRSLFTPAPCCSSQPSPPDSDDDNNDADDDQDEKDDDYYKFMPDVDDGGDMKKIDQMEGEDFEFEPGRLMESFLFPDFFEYLAVDTSYTIESTIELLSSSESIRGKRISMKETVNIDKEWATLKIFQSMGGGNWFEPEFEYYIDYKTETIFEITNKHQDCLLVEDVQPWLRLFSAKNNYKILPDGTDSLAVDGDRLRLYGVGALWRAASQSSNAEFVGMAKRTIKDSEGFVFKEIIWSSVDDDDYLMKLSFSFLWNLTRWEVDATNQVSRRLIEMISLNSISALKLLSGDGISFNGFKLQVDKFTREEGSKVLLLPEQCHKALEMANEKIRQRFTEKPSIPSLLDYLGAASSYSVEYTIDHLQKSGSSKQKATPNVVGVLEYFDIKEKRGKLTIGHENIEHEIFVDSLSKSIFQYAPATSSCKRISSIRALVDLGGEYQSNKELEFNVGRMFVGLADLWQQLAQLSETTLLITHRKIDGYLREVHTYQASTNWLTKVQVSEVFAYSVRVDFIESHTVDNHREFLIDRIEIHPKQMKHSVSTLLHSTIIQIRSISRSSTASQVSWRLPEPCLSLIDDSKNNPTTKGSLFPKLMSSMQSRETLYMRAEISTWSPMMSFGRKLFLMDEWIHDRRSIRMKTANLKNNLDLLIYSASGESFDLSNPYNCATKLPKFDSNETLDNSNLVQFWQDDTSLVDDPSHLYYGPLSLWLLAEKNIDNVELENSIDIAPKPTAATGKPSESSANRLAREMHSEVWKVSVKPMSNAAESKWTYEMHFEKYSMLDRAGKERQWFVLQRIVLEQPDPVSSIIQIEVVNYQRTFKQDVVLENFMIPEGFNCERKPQMLADWWKSDGGREDELHLDTSQAYSLAYEASLELKDQSTVVESRETLPTLIGSFAKSASRTADKVNVYSHQYQIRSIEGTMSGSSKNVYDFLRSIVYEIDNFTGGCQMKSLLTTLNWRLKFPINKERFETVDIDESLFRILFLDTKAQNYRPLNRYRTSNGLQINTYEKSYPNLTLKRYLSGGPATVVRRYERRAPSNGFDAPLDSISIKVFMFDEARSHIKAKFSISLEQVSNRKLVDLVQVLNVAECFNDEQTYDFRGSGSFAVRYNTEQVALVHRHSREIEEQFVEELVKLTGISPTQLIGPRIEFSEQDKHSVKVYFNLLKPPSAINYFAKRTGFTLSDSASADAEIKLLADDRECSKWCDQMYCVGMSYCSDRTCKIITTYTLPTIEGYSIQSLAFLTSLAVLNSDCTYYFANALRPSTLESISDKLDVMINDSGCDEDRDCFKISIDDASIFPSKFYMFDEDLSFMSASGSSADSLMAAYRVSKNNIQLDPARLSQLNMQEGNSLIIKTLQAKSHADCLNICLNSDCYLVSFCKQEGSCLTVSGKQDLLPKIEATSEIENHGCIISMKDFLQRYHKFEDTSKPASHELRIDHLSSSNQCAAACENNNDANGPRGFVCLSFDWCRTSPELSKQSSSESVINSYCLLQRNHLIHDSFDRLIFEPKYKQAGNTVKSRNEIDGQQVTCDHYSRDSLADFSKLSDKEFLRATNDALKGYNIEKCAFECQLDDECQAFEHCSIGPIQRDQTCFFIRSPAIRKQEIIDRWRIDFEKQLVDSRKCSVYIMRHSDETYSVKLDPDAAIQPEPQQISRNPNKTLPISLVSILILILSSASLGCIIQLVYSKLINLRYRQSIG